MNRRRTALLQAGLKALYYSGAHRMLRSYTQGEGIIFTLHHVTPEEPPAFAPNRILGVTPDFLSAVIERVKGAGFEVITLDEVRRRLQQPEEGRPRFACFTLDDGYRDNLEHAHPVFERHEVPYAIYVMTGLIDGNVPLWWRTLEEVVARQESVEVDFGGEPVTLPAGTVEEKYDTFEAIYWRMRAVDVPTRLAAVSELGRRAGVDELALAQALALSWDELRELSAHPLVTIGAHTLSHVALAQIAEADASYEMAESRRIIGEELGFRPRHFSFPYGSKDAADLREFDLARRLGFATAVTTRPGLIHREHAGELWSLPRVSLNGDYQDLQYLDLFLTGVPFALFNGLKRVKGEAA